MAGTIVSAQKKDYSYRNRIVRYFIGSAWTPAQRATPLVTYDSGTVSSSVSWNNARTTDPQSPNWRVLIRLGHNATTKLFASKRQLQLTSGVCQYRTRIGVGTSSEYHDVHEFFGTNIVLDSSAGGLVSDNEIIQLAATQFYARARAAQTQLQAGVIAGEAVQTIRGVLSTVRTIRNGMFGYLDNLRGYLFTRGRRRRLREHSKKELTQYAADQWLSASLGWRPLLSDLDASMKYLATDTEILSETVPVKGESTVVAQNRSGVISGQGVRYRTIVEERATCTYRGKVSRNVSGFALFGDAMSARAGLDPSNWLPTWWELIPYSFIVDYFSNAQEVISSYAFNQQSVMWVNRTIRREIKTYAGPLAPASGLPVGTETEILSPGTMTWTRTSVDRKGGDSGLPQLDFKLDIPGMSSVRDGMKWLNMAALIAKSREVSSLYW